MGEHVQIGERYQNARRAPPSGFRKKRPEHYDSDETASRFAGLPDGVDHPQEILNVFKQAAQRMGIPERDIAMVDYLFGFTNPLDWLPNSRPVVWPSAESVRERFQIGETQAKARTNALIAFGLVVMKDSPTGKRYGHRDAKGQIIEAFGFDLSPMAVRYPEFLRVAEAVRAEAKARAALKRRMTIARRAIAQAIETAEEWGLSGEGFEPEALKREMRERLEAIHAAGTIDHKTLLVAELEARQQAVDNWLRTALQKARESAALSPDSDPSPSVSRPHIEPTNPTSQSKKDTVMAWQGSSGVEPATEASNPPPEPAQETPQDHEPREIGQGWEALKLTPDRLLALSPRLEPFLSHPDRPSWADIIEAANGLRRHMDISQTLWGEACRAMGSRLSAAIAIAIVAAKPPGSFDISSGAYFAGMVARARNGELRLERSLFGMIERLKKGKAPPPESAYPPPKRPFLPPLPDILNPPDPRPRSPLAKAMVDQTVRDAAAAARAPLAAKPRPRFHAEEEQEETEPRPRKSLATDLIHQTVRDAAAAARAPFDPKAKPEPLTQEEEAERMMKAAIFWEKKCGRWPSWAPPKPAGC